jgi:hypothetical protein
MQALMHVHMNRWRRKAIDANQQTGDIVLLPDNPRPRAAWKVLNQSAAADGGRDK